MHHKILFSSIIGFILVSLLGTIGHFLYELSGNHTWVGFLFPVNESTWEHMKLAFFPMIFYLLVEKCFLSHIKKQAPVSCCHNLASILTATYTIPVLFYLYSGILGHHYAPLDISIYYISIFLAFVLRYYTLDKEIPPILCRILTVITLLNALGFLLFTYYPPNLGIFQNPN